MSTQNSQTNETNKLLSQFSDKLNLNTLTACYEYTRSERASLICQLQVYS